jgi:hypothetical protein
LTSKPPKNIFLQYLRQLSATISKIELHENGSTDILDARLSPDMLPFIAQVRIAANFSLRACCPLAGLEVVTFDKEEKSFTAIKKQLSQTIEYLETLPDFGTVQAERNIHDKAGLIDIRLPCAEYLNTFALPNFFFHLSMVYAIARMQAIPLSKGDFDGYHSYPSGFSWEN